MIIDNLQRHPFLRLLMPLVGGIVYGDKHPYVLPVVVWVAGILLLIGVYALGKRYYVLCRLYGGVVFFFLFMVGAALVSLQLKQAEYTFPNAETPSAYQVSLTEKPEIKKNSILFRVALKGEVLKEDTLLCNFSGKSFLFYFPKDSAAFSLERGDELLVHTRLSPPVNNGNPDEFDYARYLLRKGISGTAYVSAGHWRVIGCDSSFSFRRQALDCRSKVVDTYRKMGFRGDELAVLSALTVGDKEELSESIIETYSVAGASHVLALSGLHIGFISALLLFVLSPLWHRWRSLKPFLFLLVIVFLWGFAFLTGLSSSVVRAVIMCSLWLLSALFPAYQKLTLNTLGATAFLMLLFNPVWLFDVGFQLSFSAVSAILLLQPGLYGLLSVKNRVLRKVWGLITVSVAAQIGTAPLVMLYFSRFSTHFLLTNLWVIPLVSLLVYAAILLLALIPFLGLQQVFADMVEGLIRMQNAVLRWIEQLPLSSIDHIWVDAWDVFLFYLCLLLVCRALKRRTVMNVYVALSGLLLCVSYHAYSFVTDAPRSSIVFYNVRGCPSVHCLADKSCSWLVCADSLSDVGYLQRTLSPHWNRLRLECPVVIAGDYSAPDIAVRNQIVFYAGKRICLLCDGRWRNKKSDAPVSIDYLYVSRGYKGTIKELASLFKVGTVVIDSSLSGYYQDKIIGDCIRLGISYLPLSEKGSVRILL